MSITRYYQPDLSLSDSSYRIFFNEIPNLGYINTNIGADSTGLMTDRFSVVINIFKFDR